MSVCMNPVRERHEIPDGDRVLDLTFRVDWGDQDIRDSHEKPLTFCSFACLAQWASEKADQHDGQTVTDGAEPETVVLPDGVEA